MRTSHSVGGWTWRFGVAAALDLLDFTIGRIPILGTLFDVGLTAAGLLLWGPIGLLQGLEVADFTDQLDATIPTLTISGLAKLAYELKTRRR